MKKLGVIGGLGPMATAYFYQLITQMSDAGCDQEHMEILLYSKPTIPDRTRYILNNKEENPLDDIVEVGNVLKNAGAEVIAIPCITAHYFHNEIEKAVELPIVHAIPIRRSIKNISLLRLLNICYRLLLLFLQEYPKRNSLLSSL